MNDDWLAPFAKMGCFGCLGLVLLGVLGIAGLCVVSARWTDENGYSASIEIDNRTDDVVRVRIASNERGDLGCGDRGSADARTVGEIHFIVYGGDSSRCPDSPAALEFRTVAKAWLCLWQDAKSREPVVITTDGPHCSHVETNVTPANLTVENQAEIDLLVDVVGSSECLTGDYIVAPSTPSNLNFEFNFDCLGTTIASARFRFIFLDEKGVSVKRWTCDWQAAKQAEPVVVTVDGPVHPIVRATCIGIETAY